MVWLYRILILCALLYALITLAAYALQRKIIYFPPDIYHTPPAGMREVKAEDGSIGWHAPAKEGRPTIMIFHGNASSIDSNMHIFRDLNANGYGVWSVGYPGYPGNTGQPTQENIVRAALSQYEKLRQSGAEDIILSGTSLGSAVAAQLATKTQPELLILDAPFNSMLDMARAQMPFLPTSILLKDKWQSDEALSTLSVEMIWIHGTDDRIVPLHQGQKLCDRYMGPKSSHIIPGAHHTNTWLNGGREVILDRLSKL